MCLKYISNVFTSVLWDMEAFQPSLDSLWSLSRSWAIREL